MNPQPTWSLALFFGLGIAVLILVVSVIGFVMLTRWMRANQDDFDYGTAKWFRRGMVLFIMLTVVLTALATFPYEYAYHRYEPKVGVVDSIEKRIDGGDSIEEKFAVRFDGDGSPYGCLDTRCSIVKRGDTLALKCIKRWDYQGTDGYDCHWSGVKKREVTR